MGRSYDADEESVAISLRSDGKSNAEIAGALNTLFSTERCARGVSVLFRHRDARVNGAKVEEVVDDLDEEWPEPTRSEMKTWCAGHLSDLRAAGGAYADANTQPSRYVAPIPVAA